MPHSKNPSTSTTGGRSERLSSTSTTYSGGTFPKQAGAQVQTDGQPQHSRAGSSFSFPSTPQSVKGDEQDEVHQLSTFSTANSRKNSRAYLGHRHVRSRQQFYEDQFSLKDAAGSSLRDRVTKDAPIVAELRTNVIIKDEYTLVTDLSQYLSSRYQRPEATIMITVNHSACLLMGGSFEPTYVLTINALPAQVQPTLNKRNAALIQNFMAESIGVAPERGVMKFVPIPEDSLAIGGMTILGEMEAMERSVAEENGGRVGRAMSMANAGRRKSSAVSKAKSSIALSRRSSKANNGTSTVIAVSGDTPLDNVVDVDENGVVAPAAEQQSENKPDRKKSEGFLSVFRKGSNAQFTPPPIPNNAPAAGPGMAKRKSFLNPFRKTSVAAA